ncbi:unnamed protein product, partial [Protopolystoma xenopodis]
MRDFSNILIQPYLVITEEGRVNLSLLSNHPCESPAIGDLGLQRSSERDSTLDSALTDRLFPTSAAALTRRNLSSPSLETGFGSVSCTSVMATCDVGVSKCVGTS